MENQVETRQQCGVIHCQNNMDTIQPGTREIVKTDPMGNNINAMFGVEVINELFQKLLRSSFYETVSES